MKPTESATTLAASRVRAARTPAEIDLALTAALAEASATEGEATHTALTALAEASKELLVTRAALEEAHRAREVLLASVSHDLRNPLNTFAMSLGLLRDDVDPGSTRALGLLSRMDRASERMQQIIEDLLEASRIQGGKLELAKQRESASALAREAATATASLAQEKKLEVKEASLDEHAYVLADRRRTLEILRKVLAYAVRSCSERGMVRYGVQRRGSEVVFEVTSIIPNHTPSPLSLDAGKGGVTLFIARGLVVAQGGTFEVAIGEGTTFRFTLPAAA